MLTLMASFPLPIGGLRYPQELPARCSVVWVIGPAFLCGWGFIKALQVWIKQVKADKQLKEQEHRASTEEEFYEEGEGKRGRLTVMQPRACLGLSPARRRRSPFPFFIVEEMERWKGTGAVTLLVLLKPTPVDAHGSSMMDVAD